MADPQIVEMLKKFDAQCKEMHDGALQWLAKASNEREAEFARTFHRHMKGAQVAIATGRFEVEIAQS